MTSNGVSSGIPPDDFRLLNVSDFLELTIVD
jgi:hypothetical protein